jgi:cysteine sulfinate desulfinase/cysteine desulfurase-like protein
MIYLDNNATTTMPKCVMKAMLSWCNMGNPSASYASAKDSRAMMDNFRNYIGRLCEVDTCCPEDRDAADGINAGKCDPARYKVIFTSGASEANSMMVSGAVAAYAHAKGVIPHLVISAIEHKGLISTAKALEERSQCVITFVQPVISGHILARDVAAAIRPNTCLVCVMHANNETGAINDVAAIGKASHDRGVPYHCDTVQTFGKFPTRPLLDCIDSFCVSFHKFRGPPGTGVLVIKQKFLLGWKIPPLIFGSQNEGYRGGTENLPGIGAAYEALRYNFKDRAEKNRLMSSRKTLLLYELAKLFPLQSYQDYYAERVDSVESVDSVDGTEMKSHRQRPLTIVVFSVQSFPTGGSIAKYLSDEEFIAERDDSYLCNTVLLSVVKRRGEFICNTKLKNYLEKLGIVVSVGSACNTASPKASHVLYALDADKYIRKGTLRISIGDDNTDEEIRTFVSAFARAIAEQTKDM